MLRETATDRWTSVAERLNGEELARAVDETVADLAALGVTAVVDAGDSTPDGGRGPTRRWVTAHRRCSRCATGWRAGCG